MTNYERIKNMTPEEMADFFIATDGELNDCINYRNCGKYGSCYSCTVVWLNKEAE